MTFVRPALIGLVGVLGVACGGPQVPQTLRIPPIVATAPRGIDDRILAAPVDVHFQPLQGSAARPLFATTSVRRIPGTYTNHGVKTLSDRLSLEANRSGF